MKQLVMGVGLALVLAGGVRASDPTGIYARIDKVVLEPNDAKPERVQIWGTFALAKRADGMTSTSRRSRATCTTRWFRARKTSAAPSGPT